MLEYLSNERKQELCKIMASNLPVFRAKANNMSQAELADRLGFTRQTISAVENKQRDMQWSTFSSIVLFFSKDTEVAHLMTVMGVLDDDVIKTLNLQKDNN